MWQLIGHLQKVFSEEFLGCGKQSYGIWSAQWILVLDSAMKIAELDSMISTDAPN